MIPQSEGKIFLSGKRQLNEREGFRSYDTFNSGSNKKDRKEAFGPLYQLNDITLAGKKTITLQAEEDSDLILLPIVGAITFNDQQGNDTLIEAGQVQLFAASRNTTIEIANPYEQELVNFLQIWLKHAQTTIDAEAHIFSFDLANNKNKLVELEPGTQITHHKGFIGKFAGREECVYQTEGRGVFVFVIEGAFEVQYRLLEARDGLALWDVKEVEFEALSHDAIILLMELPVERILQ